MLAVQTVDDLKAPFFDAMAHFGFENVFYHARFLHGLPAALARGHVVTVSNLPEEIAQQFAAASGPGQAYWPEWVRRNDGAISTAALLEARGDGASSRSHALAMRNGLEAAQIISLRDRVLRTQGAVILNPRRGAGHEEVAQIWAGSGREVRTLAWVFHVRMATMGREAQQVLTPRQREVLEWRSVGKTVAETATIIGVTPATVEKHLRLAREALGTETTAQAILKAHVAQELFLDDDSENPFG